MAGASHGDWRAEKSVVECNRYMLSKELYCDVIFKVGDTLIKAHKCILASRSSVFEAMLFGHLPETGDVICIDDEFIDASLFKALLGFIYCGEAEINENTVVETLYVADKYCVTELVKHCHAFLEANISESTLFVIIQSAELFNNSKLLSMCANFITESKSISRKIFESPSLFSMSREFLTCLIKSDGLFLKEKTIYDKVMLWAEHGCEKEGKDKNDPAEIRRKLGDLLFQIRFPLFSLETFWRDIAPKEILSAEEKMEISRLNVGENLPNSKFKRNKRGNLADILRVKETSKTCDWAANGQEDCIDFEVDKTVELCGILLYGSSKTPYTYVVEVRISSVTSNNCLLHIPPTSLEDSKPIFPIKFQKPCEIRAKERYKICVKMKGPKSFSGDFYDHVKHSDISIQFFGSSYTGNGTCPEYGQIPGLLCAVNVINP